MMKIDEKKLEHLLTEIYGLNLSVMNNGESIDFRLLDLEQGEGFKISVRFEWRYLTAEFIPDTFSKPLLRAMSISDDTKKMLFKHLALKLSEKYNELIVRIDGKPTDPGEPENWERNWNNLYIRLIKMPVVSENLTVEEFENLVAKISGDLLVLILALLPLEEPVSDEFIEGLPEGANIKIEVNRYERSVLNRQVCISMNGVICKVCGFDFEKQYGHIGKGFIHIHHVVPVSQLGSNYKINPATDLVPLCPNCHAMVHKKNPPYTVEELKQIISEIHISK